MFYLRRVILPQMPSTSARIGFRIDFCSIQERRFSETANKTSDHFVDSFGKFVRVETSGYSFEDQNGQRVAKYGIYWGDGDSRNGVRTMPPGKSHVAAMLTAILEAVNVAREEDPPPPLLIYSDFSQSDTLLHDLSDWAKRDFYTRNHLDKMKNADILRDLHVAVQGLYLKIVHKPTLTGEGRVNPVTAAIYRGVQKKVKELEANDKESRYSGPDNVLELVARVEVHTGFQLDKNGRQVVKKNEDFPVVYVSSKCRISADRSSAGYCTHWPNGQLGGGHSFRFKSLPVTEFRAELCAIEEALKEAIDAKIRNVTVVTSSAHFMSAWSNRWTRTGNDRHMYSSRIFFERICDLCQRLKNVLFRYEATNPESKLAKELDEKCEQGLSYSIVAKDTSEYKLEVDDIVRSEEFREDGVPIVRIFKTGTDLNAGYVWQDGEAKNLCGTPSVLIRILEEAVARNESTIIVRTDSQKLIKSFDAHLEVWKRNGWRNSQHKRIGKMAEWEKAWDLKQQIQVFWEFIDTLEDDDLEENRRIPEYEKKYNRG